MNNRAIKEFEGQRIEAIDYVEGVGLRLYISGGTQDTGVFFSQLKVEQKKINSYISSQKDIANFSTELITSSRIDSAIVNSAGDLSIRLNNDILLTCPHSDDVEGWEVRWLNGKQIISLPGGGWDEF